MLRQEQRHVLGTRTAQIAAVTVDCAWHAPAPRTGAPTSSLHARIQTARRSAKPGPCRMDRASVPGVRAGSS